MTAKEIIRTYFDSAPVGNRQAEINNQKIIGYLNKHGCNVVQTVMGTDLSYLEMQGKKAAANVFKAKLKDIDDNDIFVCEASDTSATLIFEIFEALNKRKPVLLLYYEGGLKTPEAAFLGHPSNLLTLETYSDDNLEVIIANFLKKAKSKIPVSRFTVRLTKEASDYLNYLKVKMGCSSKNDVILKILDDLLLEDQSINVR